MITTDDFDAATARRWRYIRGRVEIAHEWANLPYAPEWVQCAHCGISMVERAVPDTIGCIGHTVDGRTISARDDIVIG